MYIYVNGRKLYLSIKPRPSRLDNIVCRASPHDHTRSGCGEISSKTGLSMPTQLDWNNAVDMLDVAHPYTTHTHVEKVKIHSTLPRTVAPAFVVDRLLLAERPLDAATAPREGSWKRNAHHVHNPHPHIDDVVTLRYLTMTLPLQKKKKKPG